MFRSVMFWAVLAAVLTVLVGDVVLFNKIWHLPLPALDRVKVMAVVAWLVSGVIALLFMLLSFRYTFKPVVGLAFLVTAMASYFSWTYGVAIDQTMVRNVAETDPAEVADLVSGPMLLVLALVIAALVTWWRLPLNYPKGLRGLGVRGGWISLCLVATLALPWMQYDLLAGTVRNYRELRHYVSPINWMDSSVKYVASLTKAPLVHKQLGLDAKLVPPARPRLVIMVVGETARAQNFGLDGYARDTTPELSKEGVVNFSQLSSCGTSTAISVPCMFSVETQADFDVEKAKFSDNVLDMLDRAGVKVVWRDNNSGCKDVCTRVSYQAVADLDVPEQCDQECFDMALLYQLNKLLPAKPQNTLVVLHQKGSHGPAYYKRYPKAFERFTPVCRSNEPKDCSQQALTNAYDNTILYTDHVLAKVIDFLKAVPGYDTGMLYVSDHGESLGEYNLYLHGAPRMLAPSQQTHVPGITWLSSGLEAQLDLTGDCLKARAAQPASQDDVFHSLLGIMGVKTHLYDAKMDWYAPCGGQLAAAERQQDAVGS
ncbi:phosphoethanolamine--lipid A transferase [Gallaecimonas kandeliae]|uniref:phosphoethanolamine transferase n=1 Tax=Gallaecimonas kandeliae TaxID=3029055 RepID=UPI002648F2B0|nr:phosphoethanolamine--lipid A transferase [Gallaecimonas kandeliae]WKE64877.1 phosphoethanolamine--lipid A transferase [Gallaecimonas kandeliae]